MSSHCPSHKVCSWICIAILSFLMGSQAIAQTQGVHSTKGKKFWLGYMDQLNSYDTNPPIFLLLYISADVNSNVKVSIPLAGWDTSLVVSGSSVGEVLIPGDLALVQGSQSIENKGILIQSDEDISVFAQNRKSTSSDAAIILPIEALGSEYLALTYSVFDPSNPSQVLVLAMEDNTQLEITPSANTLGGSTAGIPISVTLNRGQVYQLQSAFDLSGTLIRNQEDADECNNFAVFSGNRCAYVPTTCGFCDHLYQQLSPVKAWGKRYTSAPLATRNGDIIRIIASEDNTDVSIMGSPSYVLNRGESTEYLTDEAQLIEADKAIAVAQFSLGGTCDGVLDADPFMIFLNPVEQAIDEIIFEAIPSTLVSDYFLNVFVEDTDVNNVVLDGAVIPAGLFNSLAGSGLSWAQISTSGGSHRIEASGGVSAYVYGYGEFESYGYPAGMNLWPLQDPFYIEVDGQNSLYYEFDQVVDCNTEIAFTADTSEGRSLMWDFGDGNFASGSPVYHTYGEAGTYLLTLVSSIPGSCLQDTMRLSVDIDGIKHGLASDTALCPGNSLLLEVDPDLNITWHDGSESPSIVVNEVGIYSFFIQDGICSLQDSINVFDGVVPEANWNQASIVCPDNLLSALLSPGPWDLLWNNGATDNPLQVDSSGIYGVWMTSADQCEVYTEIEVEENCGIELHIPNAFSPNGDGLNDYFGINSSLTAQFHMQVFNRWGDLMFDSDDVDEKWDGSWKGKNQEIGTYFWIIRYSDIVFPDVEKVRQGTVTLVR